MEKIQRKCIPLMNNEVIQTYDYSNFHDAIVVGTNTSLAFYNLNDQGNVHRLMFYDELGPISNLKLQNSSQALIASTKNNFLYLWDIEKRYSPLVNYLQFDSTVKTFNWSSVDNNIFAIGNSNGYLSLFDLRTLPNPIIKFELGTCHFQGLKWSPTSNHFLSTVLYQKYLTVLDIRMIRKHVQEKPNSPSDECYKVLDFDSPIEDFSWSMTQSSIWTLLSNRKCELWKLHSNEPMVIEKFDSPINISATDFRITKIRPNLDDSTLLHQNEKHGLVKILATDKNHQHSLGKFSHGPQCILGFNWRNPSFLSNSVQHSFILVTKTGLVHLAEWTTEDFTFEELKYRTNFEHPPKTARRKSKLSSSNLKTSISDDPESYLGEITQALSTSSKLVSRSGVIGPITFLSLLGEDIMIVNNARKDGSLDGIRLASVDQFRRKLVLEFLIPASDGFSITTKNSSAYFNSYYNTDELITFFKSGAPERILTLTITFGLKYSQFWSPRFSIENKSNHKFDPTLIGSQMIDELIQTARQYAPRKNKKESQQQYHSRMELSPDTSFLYQISRCFRKKALRAWEKKADKEKMTASLNSLKQSYETVASLISESDNDPEGASSEFLKITEAGAFKVPFPVLSAGIFNNQGELVLFGNATLVTKEKTISCSSSSVSTIPKAIMEGSSSLKGEYGNRHRSYAHLMVSKFKDQLTFTSQGIVGIPGRITRNSSTGTLEKNNEGKAAKPNTIPEHSDYDLSFTKEGKSDNEEGSGSEDGEGDDSNSHSGGSGLPSPRYDVLGKLPSEIGALRERKDSNDIFPNRRPSFHQKDNISKGNASTEPAPGTTNQIIMVECGFKANLCLANEYHSSPVRRVQSMSDGIQSKILACRHNAKVVEKYLPNHRKLIQFWNLLAVALEVFSVEDIGSIINWNGSVLGSTLFVTLIEYLITCMDTQTWAAVICVLGDSTSILNLCSTSAKKKLPILTKYFGVLNEKLVYYLENQLYIYSQWLQAWGSSIRSTQVIKHISSKFFMTENSDKLDVPRVTKDELQLEIFCLFCRKPVACDNTLSASSNSSNMANKSISSSGNSVSSKNNRSMKDETNSNPVNDNKGGGGAGGGGEFTKFIAGSHLKCFECKKFGIYCSICTFPVRGLVSICRRCGHGGHEDHLLKWFQTKSQECATGCGCKCRSLPDDSDGLNVNFEDNDEEDDEEEEILDDGLGSSNPSYVALSILNGTNGNLPTSSTSTGTNIRANNSLLNLSAHGKPPLPTNTGSQSNRQTFYEMKTSAPYYDEILNFESEYNYNNFDDNTFD